MIVGGIHIRVALYLRASTIKQSEEGYSLDYQRDKLIAYADVKDWSVVDEYEDAGESGRTTKRPAFNRMVEDAKRKMFDAVLVYKLDRFSRSLQDLLNVINILQDHRVAVLSVTQSYDDSTPEVRLMRNMLGSFAQFESEMIGARVKDGMARRAKEGDWNTSPPFGYDMNGGLVVNKREKDIIEGVYKNYKNGDTMQYIANRLNEMNIKSKWNKGWNPNSIRRILSNPIYIGKMRYGNDVIQTSYEPIISVEEFETVQKIRSERCRKTPKTNNPY